MPEYMYRRRCYENSVLFPMELAKLTTHIRSKSLLAIALNQWQTMHETGCRRMCTELSRVFMPEVLQFQGRYQDGLAHSNVSPRHCSSSSSSPFVGDLPRPPAALSSPCSSCPSLLLRARAMSRVPLVISTRPKSSRWSTRTKTRSRGMTRMWRK